MKAGCLFKAVRYSIIEGAPLFGVREVNSAIVGNSV